MVFLPGLSFPVLCKWFNGSSIALFKASVGSWRQQGGERRCCGEGEKKEGKCKDRNTPLGLYHLRKKYNSTWDMRQLIHCLSKGYDHKLLKCQVLGLHYQHHKLCVWRCRTKKNFDWREVGTFPHSHSVESLLQWKKCTLLFESITLHLSYKRSTFPLI